MEKDADDDDKWASAFAFERSDDDEDEDEQVRRRTKRARESAMETEEEEHRRRHRVSDLPKNPRRPVVPAADVGQQRPKRARDPLDTDEDELTRQVRHMRFDDDDEEDEDEDVPRTAKKRGHESAMEAGEEEHRRRHRVPDAFIVSDLPTNPHRPMAPAAADVGQQRSKRARDPLDIEDEDELTRELRRMRIDGGGDTEKKKKKKAEASRKRAGEDIVPGSRPASVPREWREFADSERTLLNRAVLDLRRLGPGFLMQNRDPANSVFEAWHLTSIAHRRQVMTYTLIHDEAIDADLRELLRRLVFAVVDEYDGSTLATLRALMFVDTESEGTMDTSVRPLIFGMSWSAWWTWARRLTMVMETPASTPASALGTRDLIRHMLDRVPDGLFPLDDKTTLHPLLKDTAALDDLMKRFIDTGGMDSSTRIDLMRYMDTYARTTANVDMAMVVPLLPLRAVALTEARIDYDTVLQVMRLAWAVDYMPPHITTRHRGSGIDNEIGLIVMALVAGNVRYAREAVHTHVDDIVQSVSRRRAVIAALAWTVRHDIYVDLVSTPDIARLLTPEHASMSMASSSRFIVRVIGLAGTMWTGHRGDSRRLMHGAVAITHAEAERTSLSLVTEGYTANGECRMRRVFIGLLIRYLLPHESRAANFPNNQTIPLLMAQAVNLLPASPALFHALVTAHLDVPFAQMQYVHWTMAGDPALPPATTADARLVIEASPASAAATIVIQEEVEEEEEHWRVIWSPAGMFHHASVASAPATNDRAGTIPMLFWDAMTLWIGAAAVTRFPGIRTTPAFIEHVCHAASVSAPHWLYSMPLEEDMVTSRVTANIAGHVSQLSPTSIPRVYQWLTSPLARLGGPRGIPWEPRGTHAGALLVVAARASPPFGAAMDNMTLGRILRKCVIAANLRPVNPLDVLNMPIPADINLAATTTLTPADALVRILILRFSMATCAGYFIRLDTGTGTGSLRLDSPASVSLLSTAFERELKSYETAAARAADAEKSVQLAIGGGTVTSRERLYATRHLSRMAVALLALDSTQLARLIDSPLGKAVLKTCETNIKGFRIIWQMHTQPPAPGDTVLRGEYKMLMAHIVGL